jgi:hypothetical protein
MEKVFTNGKEVFKPTTLRECSKLSKCTGCYYFVNLLVCPTFTRPPY